MNPNSLNKKNANGGVEWGRFDNHIFLKFYYACPRYLNSMCNLSKKCEYTSLYEPLLCKHSNNIIFTSELTVDGASKSLLFRVK